MADMRNRAGDTLIGELERILGGHAGGRIAITGQTRICHDLYIGGDDARELIERLHDRFGVSFDTFVFEDYFPDETEVFWEYLATRLLRYRAKRRKSLSVGHLLAVIRQGAWFEPVRP